MAHELFKAGGGSLVPADDVAQPTQPAEGESLYLIGHDSDLRVRRSTVTLPLDEGEIVAQIDVSDPDGWTAFNADVDAVRQLRDELTRILIVSGEEEHDQEPVIREAQRLRLGPSDALLIRVPETLTHDVLRRLMADIAENLPGLRVLVVPENQEVAVISQEPAEQEPDDRV